MHPGKILRFTELMHPQKSLEEEREIAREKRRQRKKEREEEEEEEEEEESAHEEKNDAREETDESEEEEEEGDYNKGGSDNEFNGCHYRGEKLLPKVNQVMLDQDLNDDIDRKWKPGGRVIETTCR